MAVTYCNTTTDLLRAYSRIEEYGQKCLRTLKGYKNHSENVFKFIAPGYVEAVYEDGTKLTSYSLADLTVAQRYHYDSTNDILYFYPTGGMPDNRAYLAGEDWSNVKTAAVAIASRDAEALLDPTTPVPVPMSPAGSAAQPYDRDFCHAVALMACGHIVARVAPAVYDSTGAPATDSIAAQLITAGRKIVGEYAEHARAFSWEITPDEIGGHNITPGSSNTSAGIIQVRGEYVPSVATTAVDAGNATTVYFNQDVFWKIKISTGGALGTATWLYSTDDGTTYNDTAITTSNQWALIGDNIWIRFLARAGGATDFIENDTWQLEINSSTRKVSRSPIYSVRANV